MISRRSIVYAPLLLASLACSKTERCPNCGMKIDRASGWRADLIVAGAARAYDTPRCAFTAWRSGAAEASGIRVQDFYDRTWKDCALVRFAIGSDVLGPMGNDLVAVDIGRAERFLQDHGGRAVSLTEVTLALAQDPK